MEPFSHVARIQRAVVKMVEGVEEVIVAGDSGSRKPAEDAALESTKTGRVDRIPGTSRLLAAGGDFSS